MTSTSILRSILSRSKINVFPAESYKLLHRYSLLYPVSRFMSLSFSKLKVTRLKPQLSTPHLQTVTKCHQILNVNTRSIATISSNDDNSEQEEEKENKRPLSKRASMMRRDRLLSVELFNKIRAEKGSSHEWTFDDWTKLSTELSAQMAGMWDVMCMHTLMTDSDLELGRSLMKFLEAQSEPPSAVITVFYIGLLGKTSNGDERQEAEVKKYYDDLVSVTDVFDAASIEVVVEGLSNTKLYKECVNLLEISRLTSPPGLSLLRNILMGAMRNCDNELCAFVLQQFEHDVDPSQLVPYATAIIDTAVKTKNQQGFQMFLDFMQKHSLSLVKSQLDEVVETFQRSEPGQWLGSFGFVNYKNGKCSQCGHGFPRLHITDEEFKAIQTAFLDQVIVSDNIFYKTSPEEVNSFIKFVDRYGPFDVVVDGLNTLHAKNPKRPERETLERLVSHFCQEGKSVLVLGSRVLRPYVKNFGRFKPKPAVYMTLTTRADDAFFMYAALHSGKNTFIVSADKLRDHKFRLHPQLRPIFHRWLMSIQVYTFCNPRNNVLDPKRHLYSLGPMRDENGLHIPINDADYKRSFGRQGVLCLRHGPDNFPVKSFKQMNERSNYRNNQSKNNSFNKEWFEL